jgi:TRAP-type C4-dicarboxylate transport system permease small subunit
MIRKLLLGVEAVAGVFLATICVVVFLAVMDRFLIHLGLGWPEELARFLLIWCSLLSACVMVGKRGHYAVYYFVEKWLKKDGKMSHLLSILIYLWCCFIMLIIFFKGFSLTITMHETVSSTMRIPKSWVYSSLPISSFIMIITFFEQIYTSIKQLKTEEKPQ